eukprot:m.60521 g.60521  ORF g.60521 m.60521 type:complete len:411 (+) comp34934_c0_seq4:22-1254(+)
MADVRTLEHATLKVPYEILNKKFRISQRVIDREVTYVTTATNELSDQLIRDGRKPTVTEAVASIDGVVEKLRNLKRKAEECFDQEEECLRLCKTRLDHLEEYAFSGAPGALGGVRTWKMKRLDRMSVDHCLRSGFYETASLLAKEANIEHLVDIDVFLVSRKVEEALKRRDTAPCLAWCYENRYKLRKLKSTLEFSVKVQDFIELVRTRKTAEALKYAKKYFSSVEESLLGEMQSAMTLLAFSDGTQCPPYKKLFDEGRWSLLVEQFRQDNFSLHQLNGRSLLSVTLQAGLTALKTRHRISLKLIVCFSVISLRQCYKETARNPECPVCISPLNELARPLPFAHFSQSRLICGISGKRMDEHNPPMMLPSGHVYSKAALKDIAAANESRVACLKTQEEFHIDEAEKLYIM